ncbi:alpha/beta hydrolase [Amycolatopsis thailandensis]|uniref:Alpha/beta hydrolase n=1 Tax=Amycolatopsis thailandensis TaxID=589330 RepID=A0A229RW76_9PSEU|nr:alpha/beta hydrolase [Amycolatopsis thailandensis]OXM50785.1 alpha/beta hydrolase [Amycolatopsis thailandensis]
MTHTPPLGGFQEIDGRRLFAHRSGGGGPAVVFLPGASAVGLDYFGVQQEVSRFTTAVLYDRGGTGYSDPLPLPRTATAVATELRELLLALDVTAPYVLAAHSLGGFYAHRFAQLHPHEVAGLVFLDALHPEWDDFMPPAASLAQAERPSPEPDRAALREMYAELRAAYPEGLREALVEAKVSDEWLRAGAAERTGLTGLAAELRAGPGLPDVPVVALTVAGAGRTELDEAKTKLDAAVVSGFSRGEQRVLTGTLHHRLCFDRPDAVVQAIRDVVGRS